MTGEPTSERREEADRRLEKEFRYGRTSRKRYAAFLARWRSGAVTDAEGRGSWDRQPKSAKPASSADKPEKRGYLRRYAQWLWPSRWLVLLVIALGMVFAASEACLPVIIGWMINLIAADQGDVVPVLIHDLGLLPGFWLLAVAGAVIVLGGRLIGLLRGYVRVALTAVLTQRLRRELYDRLVHLPLRDLHEMKTGGIQSRLSGDVDSTAGLVDQAVISPLSALFRLLIVVCILVWIDWRVTLVALVMLLVVGLVYNHFVRKVRPVWRVMRKQRGDIDGRLNEVFGGIRVVRSFAREMREELDYSVGHHTVMREGIWARIQTAIALHVLGRAAAPGRPGHHDPGGGTCCRVTSRSVKWWPCRCSVSRCSTRSCLSSAASPRPSVASPVWTASTRSWTRTRRCRTGRVRWQRRVRLRRSFSKGFPSPMTPTIASVGELTPTSRNGSCGILICVFPEEVPWPWSVPPARARRP